MGKSTDLTNWRRIWEGFVDFLIPIEIEPAERSKRIFTGLAVVLTVPLLILFSFLRFSKADYILGSFLLLVGISVTISLVIGRALEDANRLYRLNMVFLGLLFLYLIGTSGTNPYYLFWAFLFPVEAFFLLGLREGGLFASAFYIIAVCLILFQEPVHGSIDYDHHFKIDFVLALLALSLIAYTFAKIKSIYEIGLKQRQLILEKERAELKAARNQLLTFKENLESQVLERTKELTKANTKLKEEIKARLRSEEELQKSEETYRLHFENASDAIYTINRDLKIETISPSAVDRLGKGAENLIGRSIFEVDILATEYQEKAISDIKRVLDGERIIASEYEFILEDGRRTFAEISGSPIIKDNEIIGMISVARDITDRKVAEAEKVNLEKKLMKAQKMKAIGTLAGGIAHDFNNLLMGIQGRSSLMLLDIESSHPHFEHLKGIEDYVLSASNLTRQLLGFAKGGKYDVKVIDLNHLIEMSSEMFGRTKKEIGIHLKLQPDLWTAEADEKQIEQVLLNLYINAGQAMLQGGNLHIQSENVRLTEDRANAYLVKPGKYVKLSVTDTGIGMDEATMQKVFDPFFTTKERERGTGLGLASAYGIVKNHDGVIDVYSERGKGATFIVYLPASEKAATPKKDSSEGLLKGAGTILLVDDEALIMDVGKLILEKLGYTVMVANGGQEALDLYRRTPDQIDLIILDMIMPDLSGGEAYDQLKAMNPHVKVILSSGYSADGRAKDILRRGCNGFIQKPFTIRALSQKIREIL
ncbi:MAG: response regulator [Deltaproteobacteria bacterium]|nr:response regulator [Deltaproteobacteria bacterium]